MGSCSCSRISFLSTMFQDIINLFSLLFFINEGTYIEQILMIEREIFMQNSVNTDSCTQPLITVITPSYNSEYIFESINSVLNQTYEKIQYIVIDDGSRQFNRSGIQKFIQKNKKSNLIDYIIIQNKENLGTVKTLNIGLKLAKGEYIFNLAADDAFYDKEVLKEWVVEFKSRKARIITGSRAVYDSSLTYLKETLPSEDDIKLLEVEGPKRIFERLLRSNFILGCCTAISKQLIDEFGFYDEEYVLLEDYPWMLMLSRNGVRIEYWNRPVVKYRLGGVSTPVKFNPVYKHDSDLVLEKEILPYVKYPFYAKVLYVKWKFLHKEHGSFQRFYMLLKARKQFYLIPFLCFIYPLSSVRIARDKIKAIIRKKIN